MKIQIIVPCLSAQDPKHSKRGGGQSQVGGLRAAPKAWGQNPQNLLNSDKTRVHISVFLTSLF